MVHRLLVVRRRQDGVSALSLRRTLEICSSPTPWTMLHRLQYGGTELLIDVHNTILRVADVQHVLPAEEIESYANRLLTSATARSSSVHRCCTTSPGQVA